MNRNRLLFVIFTLLALLVPFGGPAYAGEGSSAPQGPELCDGAECGPNPPPPPPPPPPPGEPPPPPPEPSYVPMGWLDLISADGIAYGWACDPNNFWVALEIHFYVDGPAGWGGSYVGAATANGARESAVADMCGGNPHHGFAFRLPDSVRNGVSRTLYAYAIDIDPNASAYHLDGSPKSFNLSPPPPPGDPWAPGAIPGEGTGDWHPNPDPSNWELSGSTCWAKELERSQGSGPWGRRLFLYTVWCGKRVRGVRKIVYRSSSVRTHHDTFCGNSSGPYRQLTAGGANFSFAEVQAWVEVTCASIPAGWPNYNDSLMMRVRYHPNGLYQTVSYD